MDDRFSQLFKNEDFAIDQTSEEFRRSYASGMGKRAGDSAQIDSDEEIDENGYKHMIFVGGTFEYAGWVELLFDSEGKYITNRMSVPGDCDTWVELAMDSAGVPTGNPELDKEFLE